MVARRKKYIIGAAVCAVIVAVYTIFLGISCSGGKGDPIGAFQGLTGGVGSPAVSEAPLRRGSSEDRVIWGGYILDIRPQSGLASVLPLDRDLEAHFNVTGFVKKPHCPDCIQLENFSWDPSAGIIDLDAKLTNPTKVGAYDVRAVLLLDEWTTGRRLTSADGLTDFWSKDPYHPDPFLNYDREDPERYFGPAEQHSAHVTLTLPTPFDFKVPFIIDASWPDHPVEPVELMNINTAGSVHPTGYDLTVSVDPLDWQNDVKGVYIDCSPLNPFAPMYAFAPPQDGSSSTWTIDLAYNPQGPFNWLPSVQGEVELPIFALDSVATSVLLQRISVNVTPDSDPPQWTGEVGIEQVWLGGSQAIVSFYPAIDPSGPVRYNIYTSGGTTGEETVVGCSHYAVETSDGATTYFVVKAEDSVGNETANANSVSGKTEGLTELWKHTFSADLDSSPTVIVGSNHYGVEYPNHDVIFGCDDGEVYSLNGVNGQTRWEYQTGSMVKSTPALCDVNYDGLIDAVFGSNDNKVYALDGDTFSSVPAPLKTFTSANIIESSPVCADQTGDLLPEVMFGSYDGRFYVFAGGSGSLLVNYDTGASIKATPSLEDFNGDGRLDVVATSGGVVRAINGSNGQSLWSYDFQTGFSLGSPAIGDLNNDGVGDVILGSGNSVYALDVKHHALIWSNSDLAGNFDTSPALGEFTGDGVPDVAISSRYLGVYLLNGADGSLIWASRDSIYMPTSPSIADVNNDGTLDVVVGSADFKLRVLNGADGLTLYEYDTDPSSAITTVPLLADVNKDGDIDIVFGTESHEMIAVTTNQPMPSTFDLIPWPKFMRNLTNTGNLNHPLY